jgi:uncharacterized protein (TIGR02284 family)
MSNVTQTPTLDLKGVATVLNACIEACIDGQKTYAIAAANVRDPAMKQMLQHHSDQRATFVVQLQNALRRLGVTPENEGTLRGAARQRLMEARHALEPNHNDYTVLRQCIRDQDVALRRYMAATRMPMANVPVDVRVLLDEQLGSISLTLDETRRRLDSH